MRTRLTTATTAVCALVVSLLTSVTAVAPTASAASASDPYGYLLVHFIEDSNGYAEKIYLDVSRGDDATKWDPLNGGRPILASNLGTTGVRDPYLTYNPNTQTYYIIATDLRVFGGDNAGWGGWSRNGSRNLVVWESKDLVSWGSPRSLEVAPPTHGMAWAPEATWVPSLNKFVVYWTSTIYSSSARTGTSYSRVVWGTTSDFKTDFSYGGTMIDIGTDALDTSVIQQNGTTYRVTKDNSGSSTKRLYMEKTTATEWWKQGTAWTTVQQNIGYADYGYVEGPALFKDHNANRWYLYVDDAPTPGYVPYTTTDLAAGWTKLDPATSGFYMTPDTKHGGVLGLNRGQYDAIKAADLSAVTTQNVTVTTTTGNAPNLPATANTVRRDGTASTAPITWNSVPASSYASAGTFTVRGTVKSIGNNLNEANGTANPLTSSTAIDNTVEATVVVQSATTIATGSRSLQSSNLTDRYVRHSNYLGYLHQVSSASPALTKQDATFTVVAGLADSSCYSFVGTGGSYLRHAGFRLRLDPRTSGGTFDADATFCARAGATSGTVLLESKNYPGRFLRHRNYELWMDPFVNSSAFAADSTFRVVSPWA